MNAPLAAICTVFAFSGCATIVGSPSQTVPIASTPSEAKVIIADEAGTKVFNGLTPTSATLNKSTGKYWGGKSFTVTITKPGYKTQVIPVASAANGWTSPETWFSVA